MSFEEQGFLSNSIGSIVEDHRERFADLFLLAADLNKYAHTQKAALVVGNRNLQQLICFCLFIRVLNSFAAVIRLAELGLCHDAEALCRVALEAVFYLKRCADDADYVETFVKSDQADRLKFLNVASDPKSELHEIFRRDQDAVTSIHNQLKQEVDSEDIKERSAFEAAQKAGLAGMYDYVYRILCQSTHTSPRSINRYIKFNSEGDVRALFIGPESDTIPLVIFTIVPILMTALVSIRDVFSLDLKQIDEFQARFVKLDQQHKKKKALSESHS